MTGLESKGASVRPITSIGGQMNTLKEKRRERMQKTVTPASQSVSDSHSSATLDSSFIVCPKGASKQFNYNWITLLFREPMIQFLYMRYSLSNYWAQHALAQSLVFQQSFITFVQSVLVFRSQELDPDYHNALLFYLSTATLACSFTIIVALIFTKSYTRSSVIVYATPFFFCLSWVGVFPLCVPPVWPGLTFRLFCSDSSSACAEKSMRSRCHTPARS